MRRFGWLSWLLCGCVASGGGPAPEPPPPDSGCECVLGLCGELALPDRCAVRSCACEEGQRCEISASADRRGICVPACVPRECGAACGEVDDGCDGTIDCRCAAGAACVRAEGLGKPGICSDEPCDAGLVRTSLDLCVPAAHRLCFDDPSELEGQGESERNMDGVQFLGNSGLSLVREPDGSEWLWFLTTRWSDANGSRLARVRLRDEATIDEATIEEIEVRDGPDVYWVYEAWVAPDGKELFVGLAASGGDGWMNQHLAQFTRDAAGLHAVGDVPGLPPTDVTFRPALLADGRTLIVRASAKRPVVLRRPTAEPGDAAFARVGDLPLVALGTNPFTDTLGSPLALPGADILGFAAFHEHYGDSGFEPFESEWVQLTLGAPDQPDLAAEVVASELPQPVRAPSSASAALSPDGARLYQYRQGLLYLSRSLACP